MDYVTVKEESNFDFESPICNACLSADRNLYLLVGIRAYYHTICEIQDKNCLSDLYLCWECLAFVNKVKLFQKKVHNAQEILRAYRFEQKPIECITSLATSQVCTTDSNEAILEPDNKIEIKYENVEDPSVADDFDDFDDDRLSLNVEDDIKSEEILLETDQAPSIEEKPIKKEKRHITKHYKKVGLPTKGKRTKRIAIKPQDVNSWIERERNSEFFKNLKNKCDVCLEALKEKQTLREHHKKFHKSNPKTPYTCDVCKTNFYNKNNLVVHIGKHYFGRECLTCGYRCYTRLNMKEHIRRHKRMVQCLHCDATFVHVRFFFKHYKSLHIFAACDLCERKFKSKDALGRHIAKSHASTHCSHCNYTFKNRSSYKLHVAMKHTIERNEACFCVMCDIQFDNVALFRKHVNNSSAHAHERGGKPKKERIPCPECPTTYAKKYNMLNHYRFVHANNSRFVCNQCNKAFLSRTTYVAHQKRYHEGYVPEKTKLCTICGRKFSNNRTLIHHIRTHTGEKPHECSYCDAKFAQKTAMTTHIKSVHFNVKRK